MDHVPDFLNRGAMRRHGTKASLDKVMVAECMLCGKKLNTKAGAVQHVINKHAEELCVFYDGSDKL